MLRSGIDPAMLEKLLSNLEGVREKKEKAIDIQEWKKYKYHEKNIQRALNNLMNSSHEAQIGK